MCVHIHVHVHVHLRQSVFSLVGDRMHIHMHMYIFTLEDQVCVYVHVHAHGVVCRHLCMKQPLGAVYMHLAGLESVAEH